MTSIDKPNVYRLRPADVTRATREAYCGALERGFLSDVAHIHPSVARGMAFDNSHNTIESMVIDAGRPSQVGIYFAYDADVADPLAVAKIGIENYGDRLDLGGSIRDKAEYNLLRLRHKLGLQSLKTLQIFTYGATDAVGENDQAVFNGLVHAAAEDFPQAHQIAAFIDTYDDNLPRRMQGFNPKASLRLAEVATPITIGGVERYYNRMVIEFSPEAEK